MAVFVARISRPGGSCASPAALDQWLPFEAADPDVASKSGSEIAVWSWNAPLDRALVRGERHALLVDGLARVSDGRIAAALDADAPPGFTDLPGSFAATLIGDDRLVAYSGASGEYPLYWADLDDCVIVSNRPGLVIGAAGARVDPVGGAWLASFGYNPSGMSTFRGISQLAPGERLVIRRRGTGLDIRVDVPSLGSLFETGDSSPDQLRDRIEDTIARVAEGFSSLPPSSRTQLQVTGGRDSRSVLALVLAGGGLERIDEFVTGGPPYSPDVLSSRDLMKAMGLVWRHRVDAEPYGFGVASAVRTILGTMRGTGCALSLHDRSEDALKPDLLMCSGHRTVARPSSLSGLPTDSFRDFADAASEHRLDPAGILTARARVELRERRFADFEQLRERGVPTDRLAEAAVWFGRVSGWAGNLLAPHRAAHNHVNLLMDSRLTALSASLPRACNEGELISFLMVRGASPDLVPIPFAKRGWLPALGPALDRIDASRLLPPEVCAYRTPPPLKSMLESARIGWSEQVLVLLAPTLGDLAREHADAVPYVDQDLLGARLRDVEAGGPVDSLATIALLGLATVLIGCEYSTRLFDRHEQDAVAGELGERLARSRRASTFVPGESGCAAQLELRDEALAGFVTADRRQRQWAQGVERKAPKGNLVRRAGAKLMRSVRAGQAGRNRVSGSG